MTPHPALQLSDRIAELLADPNTVPAKWTSRPQWRQSLAHGAPGIALLHIERAAAGRGPWEHARAWLAVTATVPVTRGADSYLYYGAPALTHALACAAQARPGSYRRALTHLHQVVAADAERRCEEALARIERGDLAALAEFDTIRGLAGIGAVLLHPAPRGDTIRKVLAYLVRLTEDIKNHDGELLPGWWTPSAPSGKADERFPGGHANNGLAHGIAGPLALLALALRRGVTVDGQRAAIGTVLAWLERWRDRHTWPYWITRADLTGPDRRPLAPQRPSWCYGTAGLARAQQLAALAIGDQRLRHEAENALATALLDPPSLAATTDLSACHGYAGLAHIAHRAAADASPRNATRLRSAAALLLDTTHPPRTDPDEQARRLLDSAGPAFLEGAAGTALALLAPATGTAPATRWDACLLTA
ncbi:lanthionine synthetase C family protein [Kitasatospora aureofaciens]|uniref:lanthionine synthetase C family protein n=1 Tax=Kitasatospora aureofaciens TaxID=1894 RepID=UPI001C477793|nr:lanthionine synthetase C family protein [Kitasatospora aureofaciens]MBV6699402.1 lanthionine synthetase C family protein [Kitasatospora aureofaciens]